MLDEFRFMNEPSIEYGSCGYVRFLDVKTYDTDGKEIEIPICDKCEVHKNHFYGKECFKWICPICGE